jgi:hypothetical protein
MKKFSVTPELCRHVYKEASRLQSELTSVAASFSRGTGLLLEPCDELGDGEGLRESGAVASTGGRSRCGGSSGFGGSGRCSRSSRLRGGSRGSRSSNGSSRAGRSSRLACGGRRSSGLGGGSRGGTRASTIPDLGARDSIGSSTRVHVEQDTWVRGRVCLGHVGAGGRESDRSTRDLDLTAAVVELSTLLAVGLVESNHLRTDQVLAIFKVGELDGDLTLVVDELLNSPSAAGKTFFEDLGPDGTLTVGGSLGHVDHDRSHVGLGNGLILITRSGGRVVMVPLESDVGASGGADEVGGSLTAVTVHQGGGDIEDGVVAVGGGLNSEVLALVLAADDEGLEGGVGRSQLSSGNSHSDGGPHLEVGCLCWWWWLESESIVRS